MSQALVVHGRDISCLAELERSLRAPSTFNIWLIFSPESHSDHSSLFHSSSSPLYGQMAIKCSSLDWKSRLQRSLIWQSFGATNVQVPTWKLYGLLLTWKYINQVKESWLLFHTFLTLLLVNNTRLGASLAYCYANTLALPYDYPLQSLLDVRVSQELMIEPQ